MIYSIRGAVFTIGAVLVAGAYTGINRGMNYKAAKATVFVIDRECRFNREYEGGKTEMVTQSCNATDEFKTIAKAPRGKRKMDVDGKAVVKVSYTAPQDGSYQTSQLRFDGRDEEFYELKAGDQIDVLVSNDDPASIIER
jgi:hypothetical protein